MRHKTAKAGGQPEFFSTQVSEARRFYLDTSVRPQQPVTVVCGGCEHCRPGYRIDRSDFPFHSIEFVARGKGTLTLAGQRHSLVPGRVFSYGPGIPHIITTDEDAPLVKYFVDFKGPGVEKMLHRYGPSPGTAMQVASPEAILRIFDDLIGNGQTDSRYSPLLCATIVQQLVLKIAETAATQETRASAAFSTYQNCRDFIRRNCLTVHSLDQIAGQCRIDAAYLCRLFRRFDDQSPYQYLLRLKMTAAAQRLHVPDARVKEIAYELGFRDAFHFSRAFKKVFGMSPDAFRKLR
ncbi:MAG: AraC family transcriptional regulator [Solirubrobacterales bacterium]